MAIRRLLGQILVEMGFVTSQQLDEALKRQKRLINKKTLQEQIQWVRLFSEARLSVDTDKIPTLGQILTDMEFITREQLEEALKEQEKSFEVYRSLENEKLGIAIEIGSLVNSTLDFAEVLHLIMKHVKRVTNSVASTLMLLDEKTGELVFCVPTGPKADNLVDVRLPPGEGIAGWVAKHEQPILVPDAREDTRFYSKIDNISGLETKSILCVPLKAKTKLIGVLEVINKVDGTCFTKEDELLLCIFGYQAAVALENARLHGELKDRLEEHKKTKDALQESEERYRTVLEANPDPVVVNDMEGNVIYFNPAFTHVFGWTLKERLGKKMDVFVPEDALPETSKWFNKVLDGESFSGFESCRYTKESNIIPVSISAAYYRDKNGKPVGSVINLRDISKQKQLQEQLMQSERLAATGQLAASVAHEINSPLQAIVLKLDMMENKYKGDEKILDNNDFNMLTGAVGNIRDTVQNLLDLNRPGKEGKQSANVNEIIEKTYKLSRSHLMKNKVKVNLELTSNVPNITASPQQLSQVFLNLIKNSIEAMSGESGLRSGRENRTSIGGEIYIKTNIENEDIVIEVSDTGPGILEEDLVHIFDPFYTGKKKVGTGVGLSICNGIIKGHDGNITAKNSPEGGAVFTITLPVG